MADGRIPTGEVDADRLADQAPSSVAAHEVLGPQRLTVGEPNVDARGVLCDARHLAAVVDRDSSFHDPLRQDALDVLLPEREPVRMSRGKVADVQLDAGEPRDLCGRPLREKPLGDPALIEDL